MEILAVVAVVVIVTMVINDLYYCFYWMIPEQKWGGFGSKTHHLSEPVLINCDI